MRKPPEGDRFSRVLVVDDEESIRLLLQAHLSRWATDQEHIDRGRELGAVYLTKPYIRTALSNAIEKAVAKTEGW